MRQSLQLLQHYVGVARGALSRQMFYVSWLITPTCNFKCAGCDIWRTSHTTRMLEPFDLTQVEQLSRNLAKRGTWIIAISGGEPSLLPNLEEVVRIVARRHLIHITTNGSMLTRERVRALHRAGLHVLTVSLDSFNEEQHDRFRRAPGSYNHGRTVVEWALEERASRLQRVNVQGIFMDSTAWCAEAWLNELAGTGCSFSLVPYYPHGQGVLQTTAKLIPSFIDTACLLELKRRYPRGFLPSRSYLENKERAVRGELLGCSAGTMFIAANHRGEIARCTQFTNEAIRGASLYDPKFSWERVRPELRKAAQRARSCTVCYCTTRGELDAIERRRQHILKDWSRRLLAPFLRST